MNSNVARLICGAFLVLFAVLSYGSALTKSATADEPVQSVAGWIRLHRHDFRMDLSNPPLWNEWSVLANGPDALRPDFQSPEWDGMLRNPVLEQAFAAHALYNTPGVDGARFVNRARLPMLAFGLLLGLLISVWAWQLAGPTAAVVAVAFFALDPNFLAHSSLVKNDVAASLGIVAVIYFLWRAGRSVTWANAIGLCLAAGLAPNLKLSCLVAIPFCLLLLAGRVFSATRWQVLRWNVESRAGRASVVGALVPAMLISFVVITWASYGFRFAATNDGVRLSRASLTALVESHERGGSGSIQGALWALDHKLLPEGWLVAFAHVYANAQSWPTFLLDSLRPSGVWYYFPLALLFKTPLVTLCAVLVAALMGVRFWRERPGEAWSAACLILPPVLYFLISMGSRLDIGVRFELPIYPFAFIAVGVVASQALQRWGRRAALATAGLVAVLAVESLSAAPNYLCFFNAAVGGPRNGLHLLGDSNLDWGQDLPALAEWQQHNPNVNLYLSYFGMADPAYYGIHYHALPGNYMLGPPIDKSPIQMPAVVAISASNLQGIPMATNLGDTFVSFRSTRPREVLNGTIYLFDVDN